MSAIVPQMKAANATSALDHLCQLDPNAKTAFIRLTGLICTIGPASKEPAMLEKMMDAGMNIARLNFSHGTYDYHAGTIKNVREAVETYSKKLGFKYALAIALDTKGPEIRTGLNADKGDIALVRDEKIKITTNKDWFEKGNKDQIYADYPNMVKVLKTGDRIFIDDGLISLVVEAINGDTLTCNIENGGKLGSQKGVNLPNVPVDLPAVSEKDKADLLFGVEQGVDMISLPSFATAKLWMKSVESLVIRERASRSSRRLRTNRACRTLMRSLPSLTVSWLLVVIWELKSHQRRFSSHKSKSQLAATALASLAFAQLRCLSR